ncbi:MAG TPA: HAD hydrolase-like protein [Acidimicrobiia bacterium]|jgi:phosphoglycolate phosphatase/pyrophosphatase PpaX|nr:HAD hydrolase-like protein [Acidimicrobiia bacterium]
MLTGVIFDLDGTLGDTLPVCFAAFRKVFDDYLGETYTDAEIRAMFGPTEEGILEARIPVDGAESLASYLSAYRRAHHLAPKPFAGMTDLLDELGRRDIPLAVVTGKGPHSAAVSLDAWGLDSRFTHVAAGGSNGNIKDRNMAQVISDWGVEASGVVSVGDAPSDVTAARTVGLRPVGAAWASTAERDRLEPLEPEIIFDDVGGFSHWLLAE